MPSVEYDLRYLRAALVDLEGYLLSKEIYWPIGVKSPKGDPPYPRLTLAGILFSCQCLKGRTLDAAQKEEHKDLIHRLIETRNRWRVAWGAKAGRNFSSRLVQWNDFIDDYRNQPENNLDRYAYEVRGRVMLQLLQPESDEIRPAELELFNELDRILKAHFVEDGFLWGAELLPSFPISEFWYLYGSLSKSPKAQ
jgi:hypothetical protein